MLALFASLKANVPFARKAGSAQAEGIVNRLHYRQEQSIGGQFCSERDHP